MLIRLAPSRTARPGCELLTADIRLEHPGHAVRRIAVAQGWSDAESETLEQFRDELVAHNCRVAAVTRRERAASSFSKLISTALHGFRTQPNIRDSDRYRTKLVIGSKTNRTGLRSGHVTTEGGPAPLLPTGWHVGG